MYARMHSKLGRLSASLAGGIIFSGCLSSLDSINIPTEELNNGIHISSFNDEISISVDLYAEDNLIFAPSDAEHFVVNVGGNEVVLAERVNTLPLSISDDLVLNFLYDGALFPSTLAIYHGTLAGDYTEQMVSVSYNRAGEEVAVSEVIIPEPRNITKPVVDESYEYLDELEVQWSPSGLSEEVEITAISTCRSLDAYYSFLPASTIPITELNRTAAFLVPDTGSATLESVRVLFWMETFFEFIRSVPDGEEPEYDNIVVRDLDCDVRISVSNTAVGNLSENLAGGGILATSRNETDAVVTITHAP